jgi:hypothetical protein
VRDIAVDAVLEGTSLVVTVADEEHLLSCHHGADAYGESLLRHEVEVALEETAVGVDGIGGKGLDTGKAGKRRARLIESKVTVRTYATHEEVDAACSLNSLLVVLTLLDEVFGITIEDVYIFLLDIDMAEEVVPHEAVIALWVVFRQFDILVHVECYDILKREFASLILLDELAIESER